MNSLLSMLAAPTAAAAVDLGRALSNAAAKPFDLLLQRAVDDANPSRSTDDKRSGSAADDDAQWLKSKLVDKLQELASSLGAAAGEVVTIRLDAVTGELEVGGDSSAAPLIEDTIERDPELATNLAALAELEGGELDLSIEVGGDLA